VKRKLLYIMGIDWEWIYQRPQILAEKLKNDYDVTVVFPRSVLAGKIRLPIVKDMRFRILWTLPYQERNTFIFAISRLMNKGKMDDFESFDVIFLGYPHYFRYVTKEYKGVLVYDCMDDHEELYPDRKRVDRVIQQETALAHDCDILFTSSKHLMDKMHALSGSEKGILVRNATEILNCQTPASAMVKREYTITYIGTISNWFDMELIKNSLKKVDRIRYRLIGPYNKKEKSERIEFCGVLSHESLADEAQRSDCLIMPFCLNAVVKAIDPVKLYEYIAFGRCIISIYYPEVERFEDFVYFYKNEEDYCMLLEELKQKGFPPKYTEKQQREFLKENTWDKRYEQIRKALKNTKM